MNLVLSYEDIVKKFNFDLVNKLENVDLKLNT